LGGLDRTKQARQNTTDRLPPDECGVASELTELFRYLVGADMPNSYRDMIE
jgi:hypothetical protein